MNKVSLTTCLLRLAILLKFYLINIINSILRSWSLHNFTQKNKKK